MLTLEIIDFIGHHPLFAHLLSEHDQEKFDKPVLFL